MDKKKHMAKKMNHKTIVYDDYSPIRKNEIAFNDPRVQRTRRTTSRLDVIKNQRGIGSLHDIPSFKSLSRHINKDLELKGKANYFAHLDARSRRRGEVDL